MSQSDAGKTDKRRPCLVPRWQEDLRWAYAYGRITTKEYARQLREHDRKEHEDARDRNNRDNNSG